MENGKFVISLDFELLWGMRDKKTVESYGENLKNVNAVIPRLLKTFRKSEVKATFSTVGFLFFESKAELVAEIPEKKPSYTKSNLSPYNGHIETIEDQDVYHFAPGLIKEIQSYPEQEIGTHTYSHYYCLEEGQTIGEFESDLESAVSIADKFNINLTSLVFPRNQFNKEYLNACLKFDILCYRGNENSWLYKAKDTESESQFRRALRLIDAYVKLSGHNCYTDEYISSETPFDIPSSRFLRPYSRRLSAFEGLRLRRIKSGMTHAAKNNLTYHLWWHPHNFGRNTDENFNFLDKIMEHYVFLKTKYGFTSYTMSQLASNLKDGKS